MKKLPQECPTSPDGVAWAKFAIELMDEQAKKNRECKSILIKIQFIAYVVSILALALSVIFKAEL